jgi:methionyl-tRNA formyltransferase
LRIVFAGTAAFGRPTLQQVVDAGHEISLVVTQPDRIGGRGMKPIASGIKLLAMELGLPIFQPERIRDEEAQRQIRELEPDAMVVVAYGQILPSSLLNAPRLGTLNVHASLLPRHRGPAPVEWAILSGDSSTGVTIMQMDAGVDTGPMLAQERVPIAPEETAETLSKRLAELGASLLVPTLEKLGRNEITAKPQPLEGVTHARRLRSEDGKLDPKTMSAQEIDQRVRALGERIGCWITLKGVELKVLKGHSGGQAGDAIPVETRDGDYFVEEVQPAGGRRMSAAAWARGRR